MIVARIKSALWIVTAQAPFRKRRLVWIGKGANLLLLWILLIAIFCLNMAHAENLHPFTAPDDASRFQQLTKEIRCVVCQNQNIADSNAPLANDLREKVYQMVLEKKSNKEIKEYLVKRYGEFILLQPRLNKLTFFLWVFPFLALAGILPFLLRLK